MWHFDLSEWELVYFFFIVSYLVLGTWSEFKKRAAAACELVPFPPDLRGLC